MTAPRREVLAEGVEVWLGDCREIVPTLGKIDACLTDPPYGIETMVGSYGRGGRTIENDSTLDACIAALALVAKHQKDIWIAAFYSCRISPAFFQGTAQLDYFGEIIWDKKAPGMGGQIRYQHENIAWFKVGSPPDLGACFSVLTYYRVGEVHPHEKPVQIMHNLCSIVPGDVILDPFCGSGTTGVAAVQVKKKFIGIEIDPKYFDISCKRISEALKQETLF